MQPFSCMIALKELSLEIVLSHKVYAIGVVLMVVYIFAGAVQVLCCKPEARGYMAENIAEYVIAAFVFIVGIETVLLADRNS